MTDKPSAGHRHLTLFIFGAIVLAVIFAATAPELAMKLQVGGEIFLRLLMMMVVPLVVASVMSGIIGLGDVRKLGKPVVAAVTYYATTTILAFSRSSRQNSLTSPARTSTTSASPPEPLAGGSPATAR